MMIYYAIKHITHAAISILHMQL